MARPKSKIVRPKRARGGQPGNRNRLKHGFYSSATRTALADARRLLAKVAFTLAVADAREREGRGEEITGSNMRKPPLASLASEAEQSATSDRPGLARLLAM